MHGRNIPSPYVAKAGASESSEAMLGAVPGPQPGNDAHQAREKKEGDEAQGKGNEQLLAIAEPAQP